MEALVRHATELGMSYAFTLHAGSSLIGPHTRVSTVHCYVSGDIEALVRVLGLQPVEGEASVYLMAPYDPGVFYAPVVKGGFRWSVSRSSTWTSTATSGAGASRPRSSVAMRWGSSRAHGDGRR